MSTTDTLTRPDALSRCDACGNAASVARIQLSAGALDFCRHCLLRNVSGLSGKVKDVVLSPAASEVAITDAYVRGLLGVT